MGLGRRASCNVIDRLPAPVRINREVGRTAALPVQAKTTDVSSSWRHGSAALIPSSFEPSLCCSTIACTGTVLLPLCIYCFACVSSRKRSTQQWTRTTVQHCLYNEERTHRTKCTYYEKNAFLMHSKILKKSDKKFGCTFEHFIFIHQSLMNERHS
jgi:hypothetical protein